MIWILLNTINVGGNINENKESIIDLSKLPRREIEVGIPNKTNI